MIIKSLKSLPEKRLVLLVVEDKTSNLNSYFRMLHSLGLIRIIGDFKPINDRDKIVQENHYSGVELVICDNYPSAAEWIEQSNPCHMALLDCKLDEAEHEPIDKDLHLDVGGIHLWMKLLERESLWPIQRKVQSIVYSAFPELETWYYPFLKSDNPSPLQVVIKKASEDGDESDNREADRKFDADLQQALKGRLQIIQRSFLAALDTAMLNELDGLIKKLEGSTRGNFQASEKLLNTPVRLKSAPGWKLRAIFPAEAHRYEDTKDVRALAPIHEMIHSVIEKRPHWRLRVDSQIRQVTVTDGEKGCTKYFKQGKIRNEYNVNRDQFRTILYAAECMQADIQNGVGEEAGFFSVYELTDDQGKPYYPKADYPPTHKELREHFNDINTAIIEAAEETKKSKGDTSKKDKESFRVPPLFESRGTGLAQWRLTTKDISIL